MGAAVQSEQLALATAAVGAESGPGIAVADRPPLTGGSIWGAALPAQRPGNSLR